MLSKFIYFEYLTYFRKEFNGMIWFYDLDDIDDIDNLSLWEAVYDDLLEHGFAAMNVKI